MKINGKKIGRNESCPCNSGLKFKKCHGSFAEMAIKKQDVAPQLNELEAKRILQQQQQGLGNPIVSAFSNGYRIVGVANKTYWSTKWKTFHDFLIDYIKIVLGSEWGNAEIQKALEKRHPILQWYDALCKHQQETILVPGEVHNAPMIGAVDAYIQLAYNLYLLAHNQPNGKQSIRLQQVLIKRLKSIQEFPGAHYETYVYAMLIKAGFSIELEDQGAGGTTHGECIATYKKSGKKYFIEAKSIRRKDALGATESYTSKDNRSSFRAQLIKALKKDTNDIRIIFIDVNLPISSREIDSSSKLSWIEDALLATNEIENTKIDGRGPDSAYVFYTNHPAHYHTNEPLVGREILISGLKFDDFGHGKSHTSLIEQYHAEKKHNDILVLFESMKSHYEIPSTFDPVLPSEAFSQEKIEHMKIGKRYLIPDEDGHDVVGELTQAVVMESWKAIVGCFQVKYPSRIIMASVPITDDEIHDYKKHPDVFFGIYQEQSKQINSLFEGFKWLLKAYSKSKKEQLLLFMKNAPDYEELQSLSQEELALIYCERMAPTMFDQKSRN